MKKGIYGGTFDPIHNGHLYVAREALNCLDLEELILMPSGIPPHKRNMGITDGAIRYEMVKMAVQNDDRFKISDYELKKEGYSYTYETLEHLRAFDKYSDWYFITGADCLMDLGLWKNVDKIFEACTFVVFNRPGFNNSLLLEQKAKVERQYGREIIFLDMELIDISSSMIRAMIKEGGNVEEFLPTGVYEKIVELGLYR
jgi:nicotinate-nucleotide adenylyltransferase